MIEIKSWIEDSLNHEARQKLTLCSGLSAAELKWQPRPQSNPVGWTFWRMTRIEDFWIQYFILDNTEIWERNLWHKAFGLPAKSTGLGHGENQIVSFPGVELSCLTDYSHGVRFETMKYLEELCYSNFDFVPRRKRPEMSVRSVFRHVISELRHHLTHIEHMVNLLREAKLNLKASGHWAIHPPSITNSAPVTYEASSEAR